MELAARRILILLDGQHVIEHAPALVTVVAELVKHAAEADVYAAACAIARRARVDLYFLPITRLENAVFLRAAHVRGRWGRQGWAEAAAPLTPPPQALLEKRDPRVNAHMRATCPQYEQWVGHTMWSFFHNMFPDRRPQLVSMFLAEGSKILYRLLLGFTRLYSATLLAKPGSESWPVRLRAARRVPSPALTHSCTHTHRRQCRKCAPTPTGRSTA